MNVQLIDKKDIIYTATLDLIHVNGFHGTAMSMIAKQAGVAIGTIYHYFPSKDVLIKEIHQHCKNKLFKYVFAEIEDIETYKDQFFYIFKRFTTFYVTHVSVFSFMQQFYSSPYNETTYLDLEIKLNIKFDDKIHHFLTEGIRSQQLKPINDHILYSICFGTLVSFAKNVLLGKIEFIDSHLTETIDIIWTGIKK